MAGCCEGRVELSEFPTVVDQDPAPTVYQSNNPAGNIRITSLDGVSPINDGVTIGGCSAELVEGATYRFQLLAPNAVAYRQTFSINTVLGARVELPLGVGIVDSPDWKLVTPPPVPGKNTFEQVAITTQSLTVNAGTGLAFDFKLYNGSGSSNPTDVQVCQYSWTAQQ